MEQWAQGSYGAIPGQEESGTESMPVFDPKTGRTTYVKAPIASKDWWQGTMPDVFDWETGQMVAQKGASPEQRAAMEADMKARRKASQKEWRGRERLPKAPPTPYWLPPVSPGQRTGAELQALPVKTPSGQLFETMPWSTREGLAGYMDWYGGKSYRDLLDEMAMMQPTPSRPQRWLPQRR